MTDKMLICCMDPRFHVECLAYAAKFFQTDVRGFYPLSVAGGHKPIADAAQLKAVGKSRILDLKCLYDQTLQSVRIFCETNRDGCEILMIGHVNTCKGYAVEKMLESCSTTAQEMTLQFFQLTLAREFLEELYPQLKVTVLVAEKKPKGVVFHGNPPIQI